MGVAKKQSVQCTSPSLCALLASVDFHLHTNAKCSRLEHRTYFWYLYSMYLVVSERNKSIICFNLRNNAGLVGGIELPFVGVEFVPIIGICRLHSFWNTPL